MSQGSVGVGFNETPASLPCLLVLCSRAVTAPPRRVTGGGTKRRRACSAARVRIARDHLCLAGEILLLLLHTHIKCIRFTAFTAVAGAAGAATAFVDVRIMRAPIPSFHHKVEGCT